MLIFEAKIGDRLGFEFKKLLKSDIQIQEQSVKHIINLPPLQSFFPSPVQRLILIVKFFLILLRLKL